MTDYDNDSTDSTDNRTENERLLDAATEAVYKLRAERDEREEELMRSVKELTQRVHAQLDAEFGDKIRAANTAQYEAQARVNQDKIEAARNNSEITEGTVMCKWEYPSYHRGAKLVIAGDKGVIEVWTSQSAYPANINDGLPSIGTVVVRLVRKDGTKGIRFDRYTRYSGWWPEGVDPNVTNK